MSPSEPTDPIICAQHGLPMSAGATISEWVCPKGHRVFCDVTIASCGGKLGLGEIFTSGATIEGFPARQEEGGYTSNGKRALTSVERTAGKSTVTQTARGSDYATKPLQELATGSTFIKEYNRINGTNFSEPKKIEEDTLCDLVAYRPSPEQDLWLQVCRADSRPWKPLRTGSYEKQEDEQSNLAELMKRIEAKENHYSNDDRAKLILLLDGWPPVVSSSLAKFKAEYSAQLKGAGFKEIWYVVRLPTQSVTRLYP